LYTGSSFGSPGYRKDTNKLQQVQQRAPRKLDHVLCDERLRDQSLFSLEKRDPQGCCQKVKPGPSQ